MFLSGLGFFYIKNNDSSFEHRMLILENLSERIVDQSNIVMLSDFSEESIDEMASMGIEYKKNIEELLFIFKGGVYKEKIISLDGFWSSEIEGFLDKNNNNYRGSDRDKKITSTKKVLSDLKFNSLRLLKEISNSSNFYSDSVSSILLLVEGLESFLESLEENPLESGDGEGKSATNLFLDRLLSGVTGLRNEIEKGAVRKTNATIQYANLIDTSRLKLVNKLKNIDESTELRMQAYRLMSALNEKSVDWRKLHNIDNVNKSNSIGVEEILLMIMLLSIVILIIYMFHIKSIKRLVETRVPVPSSDLDKMKIESEIAQTLSSMIDGDLSATIEINHPNYKSLTKIIKSFSNTFKKQVRDRKNSVENMTEAHRDISRDVSQIEDACSKTIVCLKEIYDENKRTEDDSHVIKDKVESGQLTSGIIKNTLARLKDSVCRMESECQETIEKHMEIQSSFEAVLPKIDNFREVQAGIGMAVKKTEISAYNLTISSGAGLDDGKTADRINLLAEEMTDISSDLKGKNKQISVITETINTDLVASRRNAQQTNLELKGALDNITQIKMDIMDLIRQSTDLDASINTAAKNTTTVEKAISSKAQSITRAEELQSRLANVASQAVESIERLRGVDTRENQSLERYTL